MLIQKQYNINFTENLAGERNADTTIFFITEEVKETILDFSQGIVKVLRTYFFFNIISV